MLRVIVILTFSSLKARSSGEGKKSSTIRRFPRGSSVYLIFFVFAFIELSPFSPIAGTNNTYQVAANCKTNRNNPFTNFAETIVPFFIPFEFCSIHVPILSDRNTKDNTFIWCLVWLYLRICHCNNEEGIKILSMGLVGDRVRRSKI